MDESSGTEVDHLSVLGALAEPNRRALYDYVSSTGTWVGRDEAASAAGLRRGIAAHHLDRLAEEGLIEVDYRRLTGRSGPGAGRPAKVYRRSPSEFGVSLPFRDYEFAGRLLADAVVESQRTGVDVSDTITTEATQAGRQLGRAMCERLTSAGSDERAADGTDSTTAADAGTHTNAVRDAVLASLADKGFEPTEQSDGTITLRNCPFHQLAQHQTELICGINHTLIAAALDELDSDVYDASLQPDPDTCCVRLTPRVRHRAPSDAAPG